MVWDEVNMNNIVKWNWFIVPIKVKQINDYLVLRQTREKKWEVEISDRRGSDVGEEEIELWA